MKTTILVYSTVVAFLSGIAGIAQTSSAVANPSVPPPTPWAVVSCGPNSQIWERTVFQAGSSGQIISTKHHVTEIATGLNHVLGGQYIQSSAEISLLPDGTAAATNGQHQVYFPADIYTSAIREITPDGKVLTSQPIGISYDDGNDTVLLAVLTNSVGELVASNQVIYPNAFVGLDADLRYTVTVAGFEQDVILHQRPPDPQSLSLNPKTTRLQVLTEFFNAPAATVTAWQFTNQLGMTLTNEDLDFGVMKMPMGRAFLMGATARAPGASFTKEWLDVAGHRVLVEEAPVLALTNELSQLFASVGRPLDRGKSGDVLLAMLAEQSQTEQSLAKTSTAKFVAAATPPNQGLVLDYQTINGSYTGFDAQGDTTYYVSGNVYLYGACTNEGGAVLKYAANTSVTLESGATLQWRTSAYHPVVFTAKDDNTVGEPIGTGTPSGYYANPALNLVSSGATCSNLCVRYAQIGLLGPTMTVRDAQFVNCQEGISSPLYSYSIWWLQNVLFDNVATCLFADSETLLTVNAENVTVDNSSLVIAGSQYDGWVQNAILTATNCIFANIGSVENDWVYSLSGSHNGFYNCGPYNSDQFGDNAIPAYGNPFQSAGGGNCYSAGSFYGPHSGTAAGLDPTLLADLQTKTTYPPDTSYVNQTISSITTLQPRGLANTGTPALGYHYPILDYIFSQTVMNANLTNDPGTVVGWQGQGLSFSAANVTVSFNGTVNAPCYFVRCNTVQEADGSGDATGIAGSASPPTRVNATFTRYSAFGDLAAFFDANGIIVAAYNCEFWNGLLGGTVNGGNFSLVNDLLDRSQVSLLTPPPGSGAATLQFQNCTFHGGNLTINAGAVASSPLLPIRDCAFDHTDLSSIGSSYTYNWGYNAYVSIPGNPAGSYLPGSYPDPNYNYISDVFNDVFLTSSGGFNWQSGPLGNYYLPDDPQAQDGTLCIDADGQSGDQLASSIRVVVDFISLADNFLDAFTTQTSQQPDSGLVDIGYHYPANPPLLLGPDAYWFAILNLDPDDTPYDNCGMYYPPGALPYNEGSKQAPFGNGYNTPGGGYSIFPPVNSCWPDGDGSLDGHYSEMLLETNVYIPDTVNLTKVYYFAAIDNYFSLTVNGTPAGGGDSNDKNGGAAIWYEGSQTGFTNLLVHGPNDIKVLIQDFGGIDYFSMIITTNESYPAHGLLP